MTITIEMAETWGMNHEQLTLCQTSFNSQYTRRQQQKYTMNELYLRMNLSCRECRELVQDQWSLIDVRFLEPIFFSCRLVYNCRFFYLPIPESE